MTNKLTCLALSGFMLLSTSCASIVSKSKYPLSINSTPSEAKIVITNKKGDEVYSGFTPANVELQAGSGYFSKARYDILFSKDGYRSKSIPVEFKLDGWYFGNLFIGGLIGMLIVDPATGAMYKLDNEYRNVVLDAVITDTEAGELKVYDINEIPVEWKGHLEQIGE